MTNRNGSPAASHQRTVSEESPILGTSLTTRHFEAFGRKVTTTASHLIGDPGGGIHYQRAMTELQRELRRPGLQRSVFSYTKASPTELVRSKLSTSEIQHRALTYVPNDVLTNIPEENNDFSLFQGFQATVPESKESEHRKKHRRYSSKGQRLLEHVEKEEDVTPLAKTKKERHSLNHKVEMLAIRKNMCSAEIREIDSKIANLHSMRKIVLDRLENLEQDEVQIQQDLVDVDNNLGNLLEETDEAASLARTTTPPLDTNAENEATEAETSFMSASIYEKLPSPRSKRHKQTRRKSTAIRHEHFEPGSSIIEIQAHTDTITAIDFDAPFGTMVSSGLDDTVRVWDLNTGHCIGFLEGHQASVRCLQVEDSTVVTGSMDASIRLWDLNQMEYTPRESRFSRPSASDEEEVRIEDNSYSAATTHPTASQKLDHSSTADCHIHTLSAHVAEVTALHFRGDTLVSGSADKTLRQWDLVKGRCVQTLDVLWAAAQASASINTNTAALQSSSTPSNYNHIDQQPSHWRSAGSRVHNPSADFVGALQCFDAALACGTADGMVRLWDLRSGQVHRSLVGHTAAVTCLQFDERVLVTGSADRSIRIWDLRTGSIRDAYAYNHPVTSTMFDVRRIVAAAGESVAKVYDKADGRHWDCGAGVVSQDDGSPSVVERVRLRDGYLVEGRKDGMVGVWSC